MKSCSDYGVPNTTVNVGQAQKTLWSWYSHQQVTSNTEFFSLWMKDGDSMEDHLRRMKEITNKLVAIKAHVPKDEHVAMLLLGLPWSYNTLVTALTAKGDKLKSKQVQQAHLSKEEKRVQTRSNASGSGPDKGETAVQHNKSHQKWITCFECGEEGQFRTNCSKRKGDGVENTGNPATSQGLSSHKAIQLMLMTMKIQVISSFQQR